MSSAQAAPATRPERRQGRAPAGWLSLSTKLKVVVVLAVALLLSFAYTSIRAGRQAILDMRAELAQHEAAAGRREIRQHLESLGDLERLGRLNDPAARRHQAAIQALAERFPGLVPPGAADDPAGLAELARRLEGQEGG